LPFLTSMGMSSQTQSQCLCLSRIAPITLAKSKKPQELRDRVGGKSSLSWRSPFHVGMTQAKEKTRANRTSPFGFDSFLSDLLNPLWWAKEAIFTFVIWGLRRVIAGRKALRYDLSVLGYRASAIPSTIFVTIAGVGMPDHIDIFALEELRRRYRLISVRFRLYGRSEDKIALSQIRAELKQMEDDAGWTRLWERQTKTKSLGNHGRHVPTVNEPSGQARVPKS